MYWCVARLQHNHDNFALHCLTLKGYTTYYPRLRDIRRRHGRKIELRPPLFPNYAFLAISTPAGMRHDGASASSA